MDSLDLRILETEKKVFKQAISNFPRCRLEFPCTEPFVARFLKRPSHSSSHKIPLIFLIYSFLFHSDHDSLNSAKDVEDVEDVEYLHVPGLKKRKN